MKKRVLIIDDDIGLVKALSEEFRDNGYDVTAMDSISQISNSEYDYAVVDLRLKNGEFGLKAIPVIRKSSKNCKIVILTGYASIATAVESIKLGACDYLIKPISFETLLRSLQGRLKVLDKELKVKSLGEIENEYIDFILTRNEGNISKTAKDLGIHRQSLQRKLKKGHNEK